MDIRNCAEYWEGRLERMGELTIGSQSYLCSQIELLVTEGLDEDEARRKVREIAVAQEQSLSNELTDLIGFVLTEGKGKAAEGQILEVSVGPGHSSSLIVGLAEKAGYGYCGIDFCGAMVKKTRAKLAGQAHQLQHISLAIANATKLPFQAESTWLATWGRLGLHLVTNAEWEEALAEVKRVIKRGGYFLLYEPIVEGNPQYEGAQRKKDTPTFIRRRRDYEKALLPLNLVKASQCAYGEENYSLLLWQKESS